MRRTFFSLCVAFGCILLCRFDAKASNCGVGLISQYPKTGESNIQALVDSTRLFLINDILRVGDTSLTVYLMAVNGYALDIAGIQTMTKVLAKDLSIYQMQALNKNGSKREAFALFGNESVDGDERLRNLVIGASSQVPKVRDTVYLVALRFKVLRPLTKGERIGVTCSSIVLSTFAGKGIKCNSPVSLDVIVSDKGDTTGNNGGEDTTDVDDRLKLTLSASKGTESEGYVYQGSNKWLLVNIALKFKVMVSSIQITVEVPDKSWVLSGVNTGPLTELQDVRIHNIGEGKYKLLYNRDPLDPLIPNIDGKEKVVMVLQFAIGEKTPFGGQKIPISEIGVASLFETVPLKINKEASVTPNLNKLFFTAGFGRRGDVSFPAEWKFGDGAINQQDEDLVTDYILGKIVFNDYQLAAADLDSNQVVDVNDLIALKRIRLLSTVEDGYDDSDDYHSLVYDMLGNLVANKDQSMNDLPDGQYLVVMTRRDGTREVKKIIKN